MADGMSQSALVSLAMKSLGESVLILDQAGTILYANPAAAKLYGYGTNELIGMAVENLNATKNPGSRKATIWTSVTRHGYWEGVRWKRHRKGQEFPVHLRVYAMNNEKGRPIGMVGLIRRLSEKTVPPDVARRLARLTQREQEILRMVAKGLRNREIAAQLGLSTKTVEAHRAHVMQKLGIPRLAPLVRFAQEAGMMEDEVSPT